MSAEPVTDDLDRENTLLQAYKEAASSWYRVKDNMGSLEMALCQDAMLRCIYDLKECSESIQEEAKQWTRQTLEIEV